MRLDGGGSEIAETSYYGAVHEDRAWFPDGDSSSASSLRIFHSSHNDDSDINCLPLTAKAGDVETMVAGQWMVSI